MIGGDEIVNPNAVDGFPDYFNVFRRGHSKITFEPSGYGMDLIIVESGYFDRHIINRNRAFPNDNGPDFFRFS